MLSPLAQRQVFQTANIESVRAAHEVSELIQREQALKKAAEDHAAEDQAAVHMVPGSDRIRTEERRGGRGQGSAEEQSPSADEGEEKPLEDKAVPADSHLDFMA